MPACYCLDVYSPSFHTMSSLRSTPVSLSQPFGKSFRKYFAYIETMGDVAEQDVPCGVCLFRGLRVRMGLHTGRSGGW